MIERFGNSENPIQSMETLKSGCWAVHLQGTTTEHIPIGKRGEKITFMYQNGNREIRRSAKVS
jgi:hypothetical protein